MLIVHNVGSNAIVSGVFKVFNTPTHSGTFSSVLVFPAGTGSFNPLTGEVTINLPGMPVLRPPTLIGGNFVVTSTGTPGNSYTILSSTNVALPLVLWTTNRSGIFDLTGVSSNAIPVTDGQQVFRLRQP